MARAASAVRAAKSASIYNPHRYDAGAAEAVETIATLPVWRAPGGNVTGMSEDHADLHTKLLELLQETLPQVRQIAVLWNPASSTYTRSFKAVQARRPGVWAHDSIPGVKSPI